MDVQSVYSLSVLRPDYDDTDSRQRVQSELEVFILQFRLDNAFIYRYIHFAIVLAMTDNRAEIKSARMFCLSNTTATSMLSISSNLTKNLHTDSPQNPQRSSHS